MEPGRAVCRNCDARPALHPEAPSPRRADRNGLTDMHGNVWEWTSGCWTDRPGAREDCSLRALRGGSWRDDALSLRAANRNAARPEMRHDSVGFRLVRELE